MTSTLMLSNANVTRADVDAVPVPEPTKSWAPVAYGKAIDYLKQVIATELNMKIINERFGLRKDGKQLFALATIETGDLEFALSIGLRQSYNKSLALGIAVGTNVFVCDNLCFSGDAFMLLRKNTTNVWRDFQELVVTQVRASLGHHKALMDDIEKLRLAECSERRGYAILGVAIGEGILTATQANESFRQWKEPSAEPNPPRNFWGLYSATTEGLKKGPPSSVITRHAKAHDFYMQMVA